MDQPQPPAGVRLEVHSCYFLLLPATSCFPSELSEMDTAAIKGSRTHDLSGCRDLLEGGRAAPDLLWLLRGVGGEGGLD